MTKRRVLLALLAAAVLGFGSFGIMVWRGTSVIDTDALQARAAFQAERERFAELPVLLYRPRAGDLVRGEVPFWFYRLKGMASALARRGVGYDIRALGLTPGEIRRRGPGLLLAEATAAGEEVLIWAE